MITPAPFASQQLYKVGDLVTWAWNYTSLQGTPTAIDVSISCSAATRSYALTQNMMPLLLVLYVWRVDGQRCWGGFSRRAFENWSESRQPETHAGKTTVSPACMGTRLTPCVFSQDLWPASRYQA